MVLPPIDFDGPWKELLDLYLPDVLALLFPAVYRAIDWSEPYRSLDKELQSVAPENERASQTVDTLIEVRRAGGGVAEHERIAWVLIHLEIQSQRDPDFAERMFRYHTRLYDRYRRPIVSLAILGDEGTTWQPRRFGYDLMGCAITLTFPMSKLLDYGVAELEASANLCALVVLAQSRADDSPRPGRPGSGEAYPDSAALRARVRPRADSQPLPLYRLATPAPRCIGAAALAGAPALRGGTGHALHHQRRTLWSRGGLGRVGASPGGSANRA